MGDAKNSEPKPANPQTQKAPKPKPMDDEYDPFVLEVVFPDPSSLLTIPPPVSEIAKDCLFFLDASALLAVFNSSQKGLKELSDIYRGLSNKKRLFVPVRALREYAKHRADRIRDTYQHLVSMSGKIQPLPALKLPPIESTRPYKELLKLREEANKALDAYSKKLAELTETVQTWNRSDDVSKLYAEVFPPDRIIDHPIERPKLLEDLKWRTIHHVPPAFQDDAKPDGGIGDLHIWHSMLYAGQTLNKDIVFISNDEKNDWMVRVNKTGLFARSELVDEFFVATKRHFAVMTLDDFLKLQGASPETAEEVKPQKMVMLRFSGPEVLVVMRSELKAIRHLLQTFLSENLTRVANPTKMKRYKKHFSNLLVRSQPFLSEEAFKNFALVLGLLESIDKLNEKITTPESTPEMEKIRERLRHLAGRLLLLIDTFEGSMLGTIRLPPTDSFR